MTSRFENHRAQNGTVQAIISGHRQIDKAADGERAGWSFRFDQAIVRYSQADKSVAA